MSRQETFNRAVDSEVERVYRAGGMVRKFDPAADPEGVVFTPHAFSAEYHASTIILVKDIGEILDKHFPGWAWAVMPDERNQIINVFNLHLHDEFGFTIRMVEIMNDPGRRCAFQAGSELLRRFGLEPRGINSERLAALPRDARGKCIPDISDFKSSRMREKAELAKALAEGRTSVELMDGKRVLKVQGV